MKALYGSLLVALACSPPAARTERSSSSERSSAEAPGVEAQHAEVGPNACPIRELALGDNHVCVLTEGRSVFCAGQNGWSQIGDGTREARTTPVEIEGARGAAAIAAGPSRTCARFDDGGWKCWGRNLELRDRVAFWSEPSSGPIRHPHPFLLQPAEPTEIVAPTSVPRMQGLNVTTIGDGHQCGIDAGSHALCWGENGWGQLGQANTRIITGTPARVLGIQRVVEIALSMYTTCARAADGSVSCWGQYQHLGATDPTTRLSPAPIPSLANIRQIAVGSQHACALREAGTVACWGKNLSGGLGDGTRTPRADPVDAGVTDVVQIAVGMAYTCARHRDGTVSCWGYNADGQLGDGTMEERLAPVRVLGIRDAIDLRACGSRTCVLRRDRRAFCFGRSEMAPPDQRGIATPTPLAVPCR